MYFKLKPKSGNHAQKDKDGNVVIYNAKDGKIIEADCDLVKMFSDKFERVDVPNASPVSVGKRVVIPRKAASSVNEKSEDKPESKSEGESLGKDVTYKFQEAVEQDLKVFYSKGLGFFITESEDIYVPLNKDILKKSQVMNFIKKYLKGIA